MQKFVPEQEPAYLFTTNPWVLMTLKELTFENIVGKIENSSYQNFLLFNNFFYSIKIKLSSFR